MITSNLAVDRSCSSMILVEMMCGGGSGCTLPEAFTDADRPPTLTSLHERSHTTARTYPVSSIGLEQHSLIKG